MHRFSFVDHNSGSGYLSIQLAKKYPNATVLSLERNNLRVKRHIKVLQSLGVINNEVCEKNSDDASIYKNIYESPELFRFQMMGTGFIEHFRDTDSISQWGSDMGSMLSSALTSFVNIPKSEQISVGMYIFFDSFNSDFGFARGPLRPLRNVYAIDSLSSFESKVRHFSQFLEQVKQNYQESLGEKEFCVIGEPTAVLDNSQLIKPYSPVVKTMKYGLNLGVSSDYVHYWKHPTPFFHSFETNLLLSFAKAPSGNTKVKLTPLFLNSQKSTIIRVDILNMTRKVHHHYESAKDGHKRTYTMRVVVNSSQSEEVTNLIGNPSLAISEPARSSVTLFKPSSYRLVDEYSRQEEKYPGGFKLELGSHPNLDSIVTVNLMRDSTVPFYIPYTTIYGVTLITALRLGLESSQRDRLFSNFLRLPLYEDMAPWNVVLMGQVLCY